jgi:hypothetical protein
MPNINTLLDNHTTFACECIDRLYLNGYIPRLQTSGQLVDFLCRHRGNRIPSPALLGHMTKDFIRRVEDFAAQNKIPIVSFEKTDCKEEVAHRYFEAFKGSSGVVMIGVAQEKLYAFRSSKSREAGRMFNFTRGSVCVNHYYFYILDPHFGPSFIKMGTYAPFPIKVWLNGHEWAKRQLAKEKISFEPLDNGFRSVADPARLQKIADSLSAAHLENFFGRWLDLLPLPFTPQDREAGYRYRLSIVQMEMSLTHVFDKPLHGREFFEEVIRDHLDLGRPENIQIFFGRKVTKATPGKFRTRIFTRNVDPSIYVYYKRAKLKQYFKEGVALRTELTFNDTRDFGIGRDIKNFDTLRQTGRDINRRLLEHERLAHDCALSSESFRDVILPSKHDGQRAPALRYGDPRVMAMLAALCAFIHVVRGFSNRELRARIAALLGVDPKCYSRGRMTYDLRRLRLKGLVQRIQGKHRYRLTPEGLQVALFFSKTYARIIRPGQAALDASAPADVPQPLARAWCDLGQALDEIVRRAFLAA